MNVLLGTWPVWVSVVGLLGGAVVIAGAGSKLAGLVDVLADRTGLGEAMSGALFLGAATSLPGIVTSMTAAAAGQAELAFANAIGGIAAQTVFLAIADVAHPEANLEHAAASPDNILQAAVLGALLAIVLLIVGGPNWTFMGVHPGTLVLLGAYIFGMRVVYKSKKNPMWQPRITDTTHRDADQPPAQDARTTAKLWLSFFIVAAIVAVAGWVVARSGISLARTTGLSGTVIGGLFTAIATSLPELVTTIAAVRRGALELAVGNVIGGNAFDVLFAAAADVFYRDGSLYHAVGRREIFLVALTILLTCILIMGLVRRERSGIANIGFESFLVLVLYGVGFLIVTLMNA